MSDGVGVSRDGGGTTSEQHTRVVCTRVFGGVDIAVFSALTALELITIVLFGRAWLRDPGGAVEIVMLALLTLPLLLALTTWQLRWLALPEMRRPVQRPAPEGLRVGVVTSFVPADESFPMLERTLRSLVAMRVAHDTWVLDEGDEDRVRELCDRLGIRHFSRKGCPEYLTESGRYARSSKHGNYNAWLDEHGFASYDVVVTFDPDHVARPEFLERTLGYFDDPTVGYVQAAQVYYNQPASFVARGAAEETYGYYSSIQMTAYAMGYPIVTGCHSAHRVKALRDVGGLAAHEADDLLITVLYRGAGWQGVYVPEILARGLTPVDWSSYLKQQRRWTRSVLDVKIRVFPRLAHKLPFLERMVSLVHGLYPLQVLGGVLAVLVLVAMLVTGDVPGGVSAGTLLPLAALCGAILACDLFRQRFFLDRVEESGVHWRARFLRIAKWPQVVLAAADALLGRTGPYVVTRKVAAHESKGWIAPHLAVVALVTVAWIAGAARGVIDQPVVHAAAAVTVAVSAAIAASAWRRFPAPYDDGLAEVRTGRAPTPEAASARHVPAMGPPVGE